MSCIVVFLLPCLLQPLAYRATLLPPSVHNNGGLTVVLGFVVIILREIINYLFFTLSGGLSQLSSRKEMCCFSHQSFFEVLGKERSGDGPTFQKRFLRKHVIVFGLVGLGYERVCVSCVNV